VRRAPKPCNWAPKELENCRARGWSGLGLVGQDSRTKHGQLTRGRPAYPRRPRKGQSRVRRTGFWRRTPPSRDDHALAPDPARTRRNDPVADRDVGDAGTDREHAPDPFISDDRRKLRAKRVDATRHQQVVRVDGRVLSGTGQARLESGNRGVRQLPGSISIRWWTMQDLNLRPPAWAAFCLASFVSLYRAPLYAVPQLAVDSADWPPRSAET
jgi:hypothetical protein